MMLATENLLTHLVVVLNINNVTCRALLDTGARSPYASTALLSKLKVKPVQEEIKNIDMMMISTTKKLKVYDLQILHLLGRFKRNSKAYKAEKKFLSLPNPNYKHIIEQHQHLQGIKMNDCDTKPDLPIHMVLEATAYAQIKVQEIYKRTST